MTVARTAGEVLAEHTTLELECIDRMYLNVYVPMPRTGAGASYFFRKVRGNPVPSSALMEPMTRRFVASIGRFARDEGVDLIRFERFERKDDRTKEYLREFAGSAPPTMPARLAPGARLRSFRVGLPGGRNRCMGIFNRKEPPKAGTTVGGDLFAEC